MMEEYFDDNGTYAGATTALFKTSGNDAGTSDVTLTIATATTSLGYCLNANHLKLTPAVDYHLDITIGRPTTGACP